MSATNGTQDQRRAQIFDAVKKNFGFIPNLIRELATSPAAAQAYLSGAGALGAGELTAKEQQVVQVVVAAHNSCHYCTAAHGTSALGAGLAKDDLAKILAGESPADEQLATVVETTRLLLERRGWLSDAERTSVEARGVTRAELYEIIGFIGVKTISNYVNHIAQTEVDEKFSVVTEMPEYRNAVSQTASTPA